MNSRIASQLISFACAAVITVVMLAGVNQLATGDAGSAQMAQAVPAAKG